MINDDHYRRLQSEGDGSMFLDIFAALLAWGAAALWVLTGGDKLGIIYG
jgi:hypothetical protein